MKLFLLIFLYPFLSQAVVDTKSAGYSKTFVDFALDKAGFPLKVERAYNSRSLYNGLFGFGWCSNFETRLETLPDNSVKGVECGGGMEVFYYPKQKSADVNLQVDLILKNISKKRVKMTKKEKRKLKKDLMQSQTLRADFLKALKIKGKILAGVKYFANGRYNEYVLFRDNRFYRKLPTGVSETYNSDGRLIRVLDKSGHSLTFSWGVKALEIRDNRGLNMKLVLDSTSGKVKQVKFKKKVVASYKYNGREDLISVNNSYKENFKYAYDKLHNLVKITYPDKTTEKLTYNKKKDWVMSFKNRKDCVESYNYGKNPKNSNHYYSTVKKVCGRKIVNQSKYEFWNKALPRGKGRYLYRARSRVNGQLTDVIYHPQFGTPISLFKNGVRTERRYYSTGFLKSKETPFRKVEYKKYSKKCRKPELVRIQTKNSSGKKVIQSENISFEFLENCKLSMARKSKDEWIKVTHDRLGRLKSMEDQSRKVVTLKWNSKLNKPEVITRRGVGSIRILYDSKGRVKDIQGRSGPSIMTQVSSVFNSFLQTLSPVSEEMAIL